VRIRGQNVSVVPTWSPRWLRRPPPAPFVGEC
jgi:hypothetical protein